MAEVKRTKADKATYRDPGSSGNGSSACPDQRRNELSPFLVNDTMNTATILQVRTTLGYHGEVLERTIPMCGVMRWSGRWAGFWEQGDRFPCIGGESARRPVLVGEDSAYAGTADGGSGSYCVDEVDLPRAFSVSCSKGTYIRSRARIPGHPGGATLTALRRTRSGPFPRRRPWCWTD